MLSYLSHPTNTTNRVITKCLFILVFTVFFCPLAESQVLPDKVVIIKNTYISEFSTANDTRERLANTDSAILKKNLYTYDSAVRSFDYSLVANLIREIENPNNLRNTLDRYNIDTVWVKNNPDKLLQISGTAKYFSWNKQQLAFISTKLANTYNYDKQLDAYLNGGCCYTMHNSARSQYVIKFYKDQKLIANITSRKFLWGFRFPWTDAKGNKLYSFKMDNLLDTMMGTRMKIAAPTSGKKLLKILTGEIIASNADSLNNLEAYTYEKEINDLKPAFTIAAFNRITGYGGYHGDGNKIRVILQNADMLPNVNVEFIASIKNKTIYTCDSVKAKYKPIVKRVQAIKFIAEYLKAKPSSKLNILYFDNKPINGYIIDGVNKTAKEWEKHDNYVETIKSYSKKDEAEKLSERLYCGCNFRYANDFIQKAIMFIIDDKEHHHSRWLLLPDNTVLLFLTQRANTFGEFSTDKGLDYPCQLYNTDGEIIPKNAYLKTAK